METVRANIFAHFVTLSMHVGLLNGREFVAARQQHVHIGPVFASDHIHQLDRLAGLIALTERIEINLREAFWIRKKPAVRYFKIVCSFTYIWIKEKHGQP